MSIVKKISSLFNKDESQSTIGVTLCNESLSACSIDDKNSANCQRLPILDSQFSQALSSLNSEFDFSGKCHLVLSSKHSQIVQVDAPNVPEEELVEALKWQVKDLVTIEPEQMALDYYDGPELAGGNKKLNVVVADKALLAPIVHTLVNEHFKPESITIEEFAFARLVEPSDDAVLLLCQQPNEEMLMLIVKNGQLFFQRRLRGMAEIGKRNEEELMMGTIDSLSLEIQRSSDYFERQLKQAPIRRIEVLVPIEKEAFLARKLAENSNVPVNLFALPEQFDAERGFAACIGAALATQMESV